MRAVGGDLQRTTTAETSPLLGIQAQTRKTPMEQPEVEIQKSVMERIRELEQGVAQQGEGSSSETEKFGMLFKTEPEPKNQDLKTANREILGNRLSIRLGWAVACTYIFLWKTS